jgi:hypothetical protein
MERFRIVLEIPNGTHPDGPGMTKWKERDSCTLTRDEVCKLLSAVLSDTDEKCPVCLARMDRGTARQISGKLVSVLIS